ncbi:SDR family oxidoreductase [Actinoplanes solisilvae]|uniref:SDR family oxidoreductase n=1 Tax=Actinoplanes solisilvae TaxID=2486853 RepID=UPI00196AE5E3|nr:NAD(P)H-binding protein [Actinoplanes solisilvae]
MAGKYTVAVTGATGRVGGQVVAQLTGIEGIQVRALARDPAAASATLGPAAEVAGADLTEPSTLAAAVDGADAVFLVFPSVTADAAARDVVAELTGSGRRVVYLSAHGVPDEPDHRAEPGGGILGSHAHLEGLIAASAAEYTFLRASGFAANTLAWAPQIQHSDVVRWFVPDARRALVHEADLAAVGVLALTQPGHDRKAYHLTGPEQLTQVAQLAAIGDALGRSLRWESVDSAAELFPGMPATVAESIVAGHAAMVTHPEPVTDTVARLTGRPARSFAQWAHDHTGDFTTAPPRPA